MCLLIVQDDVIHPLEFKKSASPGRDAARHFRTLAKLDKSVGPGGVICLVKSSLPLSDGVVTIPVGAIQPGAGLDFPGQPAGEFQRSNCLRSVWTRSRHAARSSWGSVWPE